mgnify:CR=1 FL=1
MIETDPWTKLFWRSLFAFVFLLAYAWYRNRGRLVATFRELGWPGVVLGLCFATASTAFIIGLDYTTVANIMFVQAGAPFIAGPAGLADHCTSGCSCAAGSRWAPRSLGIGVISRGLAGGRERSSAICWRSPARSAFAGAIVTTRRHKHLRMAPATCLATLFTALFSLPFAQPCGAWHLRFLLSRAVRRGTDGDRAHPFHRRRAAGAGGRGGADVGPRGHPVAAVGVDRR